MKRVCMLALPEALASSVSIPLEMMSAADTIHGLRQHRRQRQLQLDIVAERIEPLPMTAGISLTPTTSLDQVAESSLVFIPALWGNPRAAVRRHARMVDWLQQQYQQGATFCSVGTGSYFLAEAGLLDDRTATTHWRYFDDFSREYPRVNLQRKRFITHQDRLYCTGSVNAVRDVMLHFVEVLFDAQIADEVARHFTHELKRSFEALLLATDQKNSHHDEQIIKVQEWLQKHYTETINLTEVAQRFGLNSRTFNRRFRLAAGKTPMQYLQEVRVDQARELLKQSNLSIAEIAFAVAYQDVSYFTGLFKRLQGVTPNAYRRLVRNKVFNVHQEG